ncbi:MAG: ribonuclease HI family protein [Candidatus Magasanikbacteria bacterium]
MKLTLYTDGGSRGNPGEAASGIVIKDEQGKLVVEFGEYLGRQTNNYAEYMAIIFGFQKAKELGADELLCFVDSKLVAEQLNRNWKVKEPSIQKLFLKAWKEMQGFKKVEIRHILRGGNIEADAQVNKILDEHQNGNPEDDMVV